MDRFPQTSFPYLIHPYSSNSQISTYEIRDWYANAEKKKGEYEAYSQTRISNNEFDNEFAELDNSNPNLAYESGDEEMPEISLGGLAELYNDGWDDEESENAYFRFIIGAKLAAIPIDSIEPDLDEVEDDDEDNENNFPVWKLKDASSRNDKTVSLQNNVIQHKEEKRTRVGILGYDSSGDESSADVDNFKKLRRINTKWNRATRVTYHSVNNKQGIKREHTNDKDDAVNTQTRQKMPPMELALDGNAPKKCIHWAKDVKTFDGPTPGSDFFWRMSED